MLGRKLKNSGMTLVEVLVSMFVLSIAAVTVITAFSMAAQVNTKAKRQQGAEALMENMLEYAEAGGTDFKGWFLVDDDDYDNLTPEVTPAPGVTPTPQTVKKEELRNMESGHLKYTVKITTDTAPAKYNSGTSGNTWLNDFSVIQFGGSDSNAILIDATGSNYDDQAVAVFYSMHQNAIIQHDAEELALAEEDEEGDYEPDLWQGTDKEKSEDDISDSLDREIWIQSKQDGLSADKFRLVAHMSYTFNGTAEMPDSADLTYEIPLCYSEVFDKDTGAEDQKHLNQIYVMYSAETTGNNSEGVDVRIWDPTQVLTVNLYAIKQATNGKDVINPVDGELTSDFKNAVKNGNLDAYYSGGAGNIVVSCRVPETTENKTPKSVTIYSPSTIDLKSGEYEDTQVTTKDKDLVAEGDEVRVVTITIEIIDPDTGNRILTPETVTRLQ